MSAAILLGGGRRARIVTAPGRISVALVCRPYSAIRSLTPRPITAKIELPERRASMLRIARVSWAHLALVAFVAATPATAFAQLTKAGVVTTLLGTATVSRASLSQPLPLKFKDDVFVQDRVITGDDSVARILLGGKAIVTVRTRSSLTISEVPGVTRSLTPSEAGQRSNSFKATKTVPPAAVNAPLVTLPESVRADSTHEINSSRRSPTSGAGSNIVPSNIVSGESAIVRPPDGRDRRGLLTDDGDLKSDSSGMRGRRSGR